MEANEKRRIVEALILSSPEPISALKLAEIIPYCKAGQAKDLVNELNTEYAEQHRSFEIWEVAGGFQLRTRAEFSGYLQKLQKERALRLSQAALETLAIIAYRQPVTRAEIEEVRGVDAGAVVKSLLERHLIRIAGQREVPGRPMLYATSRRFLEVFGLDTLKGLPTLRELDELAREHGLLETSGGETIAATDGDVIDPAEVNAGEVSPAPTVAMAVADASDGVPTASDDTIAEPALHLVEDSLRVEDSSSLVEDSLRVEDSSSLVEDSLRVEDSSSLVEDSLRVEDSSSLVEDSLRVEDSSSLVEDSTGRAGSGGETNVEDDLNDDESSAT